MSPQNSNIVNVLKVALSSVEITVLLKGLSYCAATGGFSEFQLFMDLDNFAWNLRLREFFHRRACENCVRNILPSQKHWTPLAQWDKYLDLYIRAVQDDILNAYKVHTTFRHNLSRNETTALEQLSSHQDVVIKPAHKGGAIVVMNCVLMKRIDSYLTVCFIKLFPMI